MEGPRWTKASRMNAQGSTKYGQLAQVVLLAAAAAFAFGYVTVAKDSELRHACIPLCSLHPAYAGAARRAPDFALPGLHGETIKLSDYRGKIVVLNFWTQTCQPCVEEMPDLAEFAEMTKARPDVALLTISADESADAARQFYVAQFGKEPPFPVAMDPNRDVIRGAFGTTLFPETWVIDKDGVIVARFDGKRDWTDGAFVETIDALRRGQRCDVSVSKGEVSGLGKALCAPRQE